MKAPDYFYTIDKSACEIFKDRGSRFIAYAYPLADAKSFKKYLQDLKKEHTKAVHHCFAYRLGLNTDNFRSSDDGEPGGVAGKQILAQIDSRQLTNISVIVVRYFGGSLLGVPGLINAYKTATALVLQTIPIVQKQVEHLYSIEVEYTRLHDIIHVLKQANCKIHKQDNQLFSTVITGIPQSRLELVLSQLREFYNIQISKVDG